MDKYMMEDMYIQLFKEKDQIIQLGKEHLMTLVDLVLDMYNENNNVREIEWFNELTLRLKVVE